MIKKRLLPFLCFLFCALAAKANFNYDDNCISAYRAILGLRMKDAKLLLQKEKQLFPQNGIPVLLDNYMDYFSLLASENKADYNRLKDKKSERIAELEKNDRNSPYYLFSQAEVYLQWSLLKARFGDYSSSSFDAKKAERLLKENIRKYPDFLPNQINRALVNVIFGSIPGNFRFITSIFGMEGDVKAGIKELEELQGQLPATKYGFYNQEVIYFLCNIEMNVLHSVNSYAKQIAYLNNMDANSLLKVYLQGLVAAKTGHNDESIAYLQDAPISNQYIALPALYYLLGNAKLNRMDDDAPVALKKFVDEFRGVNLIKDAHLKLAYYYLMHNDTQKYAYFIKLVKSKGYTFDEKDSQALMEANDAKPDLGLLKARFYFDGGYYNKALEQIVTKDAESFKLLRDKIELYYRLGRIYDKTNKTGLALLNYQKAINLGKNTRYYFAANAALNAGRIYEEKRDFKSAVDYYNRVLDMKEHQYQNSIDNDAKEGLKRINR